MASLLANHIPIEVVKTTDDTTELTNTEQEAAGQTFLQGVPVQLNAGNVQVWDGVTIAGGILGISLENAHNLATAGAGAPGGFTPVGFPGTGVATVPTKANIGQQFGMSFDVNNHAYIDFAKVTPGVNTVVIIYDLDPI